MLSETFTPKSVVAILKSASLNDAAKLMRDAHVGDLVVIEQQGPDAMPVGILTDRDIVLSTIALGIDPRALRVEDIMSPDPITADVGDGLAHIVSLMKEHGCRRIPLVNAKGALVSIVAADDVISVLATELASLAALPGMQMTAEAQRRRKVA
jgi:CBS domain-containing protein